MNGTQSLAQLHVRNPLWTYIRHVYMYMYMDYNLSALRNFRLYALVSFAANKY